MSDLKKQAVEALVELACEPIMGEVAKWDLASTYKHLTVEWPDIPEMQCKEHEELVSSLDTVCEYYFGKEAWQRVKEGL